MTAPTPTAPTPRAPCLVVASKQLRRTLFDLSVFESLAATGRPLVIAAPADHALILDPSLLELRLEHTPGDLTPPLSVHLEEVSAQGLARLGCSEALLLEPTVTIARRVASAGIEPRWGEGRSLARFWLKPALETQQPSPEPGAARNDRQSLLESIGVPWRPRQELKVTAGWHDVGQRRLEQAKLETEGSPIVGVYLGTSGGGKGGWPAARYEALLRQLRREQPGWQFVILATDGDLWQAVKLFEKTGKIHPVIGPDLPLDFYAGLLSELDLVIAGDSWPLYLAAAVGGRCLALLTTDQQRWRPSEDSQLSLIPSKLKELEVDEVVERVLTLGVQRRPRRARRKSGGPSPPKGLMPEPFG